MDFLLIRCQLQNEDFLNMAATIEHLPPEILELIFQELSLKDINNCSQTCLWWSYCIEEFFKNKGKCKFFTSK